MRRSHARLINQHRHGEERVWRLQCAGGEVLDGPLRLHAVVRLGGDVHLAQGIALDTRGPLPSIILLGILPSFFDSLVQLITRTSTDLPPDARKALAAALQAEEQSTRARPALTDIATHHRQ